MGKDKPHICYQKIKVNIAKIVFLGQIIQKVAEIIHILFFKDIIYQRDIMITNFCGISNYL